MLLQAQLLTIFEDIAQHFDPHIFDPDWYIDEFYPRSIGDENLQLIKSNIQIGQIIRERSVARKINSLCDLGGGGTLWAEMIYGIHVDTICYTDYLEKNRKIVADYIRNPHNPYWDLYIEKVIETETSNHTSSRTVYDHALEIKNKITIEHCDVFSENPLGVERKFDIVMANFVMESVTSDYNKWIKLMANAESLVSDSGFFVVAAIEKAKGYNSNNSQTLQPAVYITTDDILGVLNKLKYDVFYTKLIPAQKNHSDQYENLVVVAGQKK